MPIKNKIKGKERLYSKEQIEDMIAEQVMTRMRKGELITHPSDPRKYKTPSQKLSDEIKNKYQKCKRKGKINILFLKKVNLLKVHPQELANG